MLHKANLARYENLANLDKPGLWRQIVSPIVLVILIFLISLLFSVLLVVLSIDWTKLQSLSGDEVAVMKYLETFASTFNPLESKLGTVLSLIASASLLIPLAIVIRFINGRTLKSLITASEHIDYPKIFKSAGIYLVILLLFSVLGYFLSGMWPVFSQQSIVTYLIFVLVLSPLIFLQVVSEEILFRGYVFQNIVKLGNKIVSNLKYKQASILIGFVISTIVFGFAHSSSGPFMAGIYVAIQYFIFAFFLQYIAYKNNGLETSIGIHFAHNIMGFLLIGSVLDGAGVSLFIDKTSLEQANTIVSLLFVPLPLLLTYYFLFLNPLTKTQSNGYSKA